MVLFFLNAWGTRISCLVIANLSISFTKQCLVCLSVLTTLRQSTDIDSIIIAINGGSYCQRSLQLGFVQKSKGDIFVPQLSQKCKWEHDFLRFLLCGLLQESNGEEQIKIILLWVCYILGNSISTNIVYLTLSDTYTEIFFPVSLTLLFQRIP